MSHRNVPFTSLNVSSLTLERQVTIDYITGQVFVISYLKIFSSAASSVRGQPACSHSASNRIAVLQLSCFLFWFLWKIESFQQNSLHAVEFVGVHCVSHIWCHPSSVISISASRSAAESIAASLPKLKAEMTSGLFSLHASTITLITLFSTIKYD